MNSNQSMKAKGDVSDDLSELQNLQIRYVDVIQNLKTERTTQDEKHVELRRKYERLKSDFLYNMQLLQGRDAELVANENAMHEFSIQIGAKEKEISDLKVKIDQLIINIGNEEKAREQLQIHYQQRIREKQKEVEQYRRDRDAEITQERNNLEVFKRNLERQIKELEEELDLQQRQSNADFDEAARKREHEFRIQIDELNNTILGHEIKVKLLGKELELAKATYETNGKEIRHVENAQRDLEKQLRKKEWELEEIKALKDARISDIEEKLVQSDLRVKQLEDDFMRKHSNLDQALKRKEMELGKAQESWTNRESHLQETIECLTKKLEESEMAFRQLQWALDDAIKEKRNVTEKLEAEIVDIKTKWEHHVAEISHESVTKTVHMNALREAEETLQGELLRRTKDIDRYKKDLAESLERESTLERAKAQVDLDWQRRCEELERLNYQRSEDLVKNLTRSRDEALATVNEQKSEMEQMEKVANMLQKERDQVLSVLIKHGLKVESLIEVPTEGFVSEVVNLREQNKRLQVVIKQMKDDMESLTTNIPNNAMDPIGQRIDRDYVKSLEDDLSALRINYRQLEVKFHDLETVPGLDAKSLEDHPPIHDNASVNAHMEQLNNTISVLRKEKVDLTAQLRKQQTASIHLQGRIDQLSKQPVEKQSQIDQLQYELNACKRRNETEVLSLRQRIADLELQVTEARKEADEYYRASTESNAEVTALSNQVSQLKLELACANPTVNFGAQELVIQQLEDVITQQIHHPGARKFVGQTNAEIPTTEADSVDAYKARLRMAVKDLIQIAKKNQVLTEINNRLLAEMTKNGIRPSVKQQAPTSQHLRPISTKVNQSVQSKLQQLEELQYQITKQELAMRGQNQKTGRIIVEENGEDIELHSILKKPASQFGELSSVAVKPLSPSTKHPKNASSPNSLNFQLSNSSLGGESLQEIWEFIDDEGNTTPRTGIFQQNPSASRKDGSVDSWTVTGTQPPIAQRQTSSATRKKPMTTKASTSGRAKPHQRHRPGVVNYNRLRGSTDSL